MNEQNFIQDNPKRADNQRDGESNMAVNGKAKPGKSSLIQAGYQISQAQQSRNPPDGSLGGALQYKTNEDESPEAAARHGGGSQCRRRVSVNTHYASNGRDDLRSEAVLAVRTPPTSKNAKVNSLIYRQNINKDSMGLYTIGQMPFVSEYDEENSVRNESQREPSNATQIYEENEETHQQDNQVEERKAEPEESEEVVPLELQNRKEYQVEGNRNRSRNRQQLHQSQCQAGNRVSISRCLIQGNFPYSTRDQALKSPGQTASYERPIDLQIPQPLLVVMNRTSLAEQMNLLTQQQASFQYPSAQVMTGTQAQLSSGDPLNNGMLASQSKEAIDINFDTPGEPAAFMVGEGMAQQFEVKPAEIRRLVNVNSMKMIKMLKVYFKKESHAENQANTSSSQVTKSINIPDSILIELDLDDHGLPEMRYVRNENGTISTSKIKVDQVEAILFKWLNRNLEKQKAGTFIPISVTKWAILPKEQSLGLQKDDINIEQPSMGIDFFVASALFNLNVLCEFWRKAQEQEGFLKGQCLNILIQRYSPVKEEHAWAVRMHWRQDRGFRIYKHTHCYPLNTAETVNYQVLSDLFDNLVSKLSPGNLEKQVTQIHREAIGRLNLYVQKLVEQQNRVNQTSLSLNSVTSSMTHLHQVNSSSAFAGTNECIFWKLETGQPGRVASLNHVLLNTLLTAPNTPFLNLRHQFTMQDIDKGTQNQNQQIQKLKYRNGQQEAFQSNRLISDCKKIMLNLLQVVKSSLESPGMSLRVEKLTCDLVPEYDFKTKQTSLLLLALNDVQVIEKTNPFQPGLEEQRRTISLRKSHALDALKLKNLQSQLLEEGQRVLSLPPEIRHSVLYEQELVNSLRRQHLQKLKLQIEQGHQVMLPIKNFGQSSHRKKELTDRSDKPKQQAKADLITKLSSISQSSLRPRGAQRAASSSQSPSLKLQDTSSAGTAVFDLSKNELIDKAVRKGSQAKQKRNPREKRSKSAVNVFNSERLGGEEISFKNSSKKNENEIPEQAEALTNKDPDDQKYMGINFKSELQKFQDEVVFDIASSTELPDHLNKIIQALQPILEQQIAKIISKIQKGFKNMQTRSEKTQEYGPNDLQDFKEQIIIEIKEFVQRRFKKRQKRKDFQPIPSQGTSGYLPQPKCSVPLMIRQDPRVVKINEDLTLVPTQSSVSSESGSQSQSYNSKSNNPIVLKANQAGNETCSIKSRFQFRKENTESSAISKQSQNMLPPTIETVKLGRRSQLNSARNSTIQLTQDLQEYKERRQLLYEEIPSSLTLKISPKKYSPNSSAKISNLNSSAKKQRDVKLKLSQSSASSKGSQKYIIPIPNVQLLEINQNQALNFKDQLKTKKYKDFSELRLMTTLRQLKELLATGKHRDLKLYREVLINMLQKRRAKRLLNSNDRRIQNSNDRSASDSKSQVSPNSHAASRKSKKIEKHNTIQDINESSDQLLSTDFKLTESEKSIVAQHVIRKLNIPSLSRYSTQKETPIQPLSIISEPSVKKKKKLALLQKIGVNHQLISKITQHKVIRRSRTRQNSLSNVLKQEKASFDLYLNPNQQHKNSISPLQAYRKPALHNQNFRDSFEQKFKQKYIFSKKFDHFSSLQRIRGKVNEKQSLEEADSGSSQISEEGKKYKKSDKDKSRASRTSNMYEFDTFDQ